MIALSIRPTIRHTHPPHPTLQVGGIPTSDRDTVDFAHWIAYDAASECLLERRESKPCKHPCEPLTPGKLLHFLDNVWRHFRSRKEAVDGVTGEPSLVWASFVAKRLRTPPPPGKLLRLLQNYWRNASRRRLMMLSGPCLVRTAGDTLRTTRRPD